MSFITKEKKNTFGLESIPGLLVGTYFSCLFSLKVICKNIPQLGLSDFCVVNPHWRTFFSLISREWKKGCERERERDGDRDIDIDYVVASCMRPQPGYSPGICP